MNQMEGSKLIELAGSYLPEDKVALLKGAYEFAAKAHRGQLRRTGGPYVEHPLNAAVILAELHLDAETLAAALLHDVPEDCGISLEEIEANFGLPVVKLVDGVTKLSRLSSIAIGRGFGNSASDSLVRSITVVVVPETRQLSFEIPSIPEWHVIEVFAPDRSDQPFDEGV